jgi:hypothetical protein
MGQRAYAVSLAWRVGAFLLVTLGFPLLTVLIMNVSNCRSVGGACGAVALVSGMALKPVIFLIFVGSITWITVARMRDLGLPGLVGLLVPVLLLMDWQFGVMLGAHWSVGFVMGGLLGAPCQFLSAFLCMGFLACVATREDGGSAAERFGIASKLALAVTALILVAGLMRIAFFGWLFSAMASGKQGTINPAMPLLRIVGIVTLVSPFLVAIQAGLFGLLIWRSRTGGGDGPALRGLASPTASSVPSFGRRR